MKFPRIKLGRVFWGCTSITCAALGVAGYAVVQASDIADSREKLTPGAQCTITHSDGRITSFYSGWSTPDALPENAEFNPYFDPFPGEIEQAHALGRPIPQGGAEQALDDCMAYIDEHQGINMRSVRVNVSIQKEHGHALPFPVGQHPVDHPESNRTANLRLGNKWAANEAIDRINEYRDLVDDMRQAFEADDNMPLNTKIQIQRRVREEITDAAEGGNIIARGIEYVM